MSIVALALNGFLAVLLIAALVMGWRLERRLRGVRESHTVFAKAVGELDAATARAHAGLAELRAATDEAIDLLGGRIARAREACERLDRGIAQAEAAAPRAAPPATPAREAVRPARGPTDLRGLLDLVESARGANGFTPLRAPAPRARPRMADEELFDDVGARP